MKIIILLVLLSVVTVTPVYGQLSDATGFVHNLDVSASGYVFPVQVVANFGIPDFTFNEEEKTLTLFISSSLDNNLGEVILPKELLGGNLTFSLNGEAYHPTVRDNQKISFITLNFIGSGENTMTITGTTHLFGLVPTNIVQSVPPVSEKHDSDTLELSLLVLILSLIAAIITVLYLLKLKKNKQR